MMPFTNSAKNEDSLLKKAAYAYRGDESSCVKQLLKEIKLSKAAYSRIYNTAYELVLNTREHRRNASQLDNFLNQYDLSSEEGIALMCMAEALLRIPDKETVDKLIADKLSQAAWEKHLSTDKSLFMNATTWSLMLTGRIYAPAINHEVSLRSTLKKFFTRSSSALIRPIIMQGMKIIGKQFVMGRSIEEALKRAQTLEKIGYSYSYDMLGEAAKTAEDAEKYLASYVRAIHAIGAASEAKHPNASPGISIKLSALHPRYEYTQRARVLNELTPKLLMLAQLAKQYNIGLTVDAEEADRLELSLEIFAEVFNDDSLKGYEGFGLAVQAYQKRAPFVIDWLIELSQRQKRKIMIRLIKGAYWDAEIKLSQVLGFEGYPVFTRKNATDVSYIACAQKIIAHLQCFYPQFGTHNAYTVAAILELMPKGAEFEFQCLHGMGRPLYDQLVANKEYQLACRIYAPVGSHQDLLGYLVRRLLENGANTSFVNRIADENLPVEALITNPVERMQALENIPHPNIPLPENIYGQDRLNAKSIDLSNTITRQHFYADLNSFADEDWQAGPLIKGKVDLTTNAQPIFAPANLSLLVGHVHEANETQVEAALKVVAADKQWQSFSVTRRADILDRIGLMLEENIAKFANLLCLEAGKHIIDALSEIRETVDFCRYYAREARLRLTPQILMGPTGEYNELSLHPRGVIVCISPWNFPLAIFAGQVVAALAAGNCVIAKPAEQTPIIAVEAVKLMIEAGVPADSIALLPGTGEVVGAKLVSDPRIHGVMFTGSTETAKIIQKALADRPGPILPLIAETGGQNAMIVDSSALPEQVVADVMNSAFNSAGQRCSALRVLFVQSDIAPRLLPMLEGAMRELSVGDPANLANDIGPVIDAQALDILNKHAEKLHKEGKLLYKIQPNETLNGHYFAPCAFEINSLHDLEREVFGPILHIVQFKNTELPKVIKEINDSGYGLTLGVHSRIDATIDYIQKHVAVGNIYINRNMVGAVVGVQPFGGEGLSGTGPKAGGPYYLPRLCVERAISINTTASGGNTTLISLIEED